MADQPRSAQPSDLSSEALRSWLQFLRPPDVQEATVHGWSYDSLHLTDVLHKRSQDRILTVVTSHSMRTEAIVAAALEIAEERGVAGITTGALARRFNFTEAALYRYFAGKAAIVASALQYLGERVFATMLIELMPEAVVHGQTIKAQLEGHIGRFALRQGLLLELLVAAAGGRDREVQEAGDAFLREYETQMNAYFTELQERTLIAATPSGKELGRLWICQLLGGFVRCRLTREPWDPAEQSGFEAFLGQMHAPRTAAART